MDEEQNMFYGMETGDAFKNPEMLLFAISNGFIMKKTIQGTNRAALRYWDGVQAIPSENSSRVAE